MAVANSKPRFLVQWFVFPGLKRKLNISVSPACITLTKKYTSQLLFITYASLFDNLNTMTQLLLVRLQRHLKLL